MSQADFSIAPHLAACETAELARGLDERGYVCVPGLLDSEACRGLIALYDQPARFRKRIVMGQHGFGRGEYQYFARPLPELVQVLREQLYPRLAPIANAWAERLGDSQRYPDSLQEFSQLCAAAGQERPTPLLLKYGPGDYNCLHQDLYGALAFPLQLTVLLCEPREFSGGEFVLAEQRPRMQSRVEVVPLARGDAVIFAVAKRPVVGARGDYRVAMRHGVSRIRSGTRMTLGVIFHDAE